MAADDYRLNTLNNDRDYDVTPFAPVWEDQVDYPPGAIVMYYNVYWQTTCRWHIEG